MITTLCYLEKDEKYLMLHRTKKKNDINKGKWLGIGGKLEAGETPEECLKREVQEETGYKLNSYKFRGLVIFNYNDDEPLFMYLYTSSDFSGNQHECDEGNLKWIPKKEIFDLKKEIEKNKDFNIDFLSQEFEMLKNKRDKKIEMLKNCNLCKRGKK